MAEKKILYEAETMALPPLRMVLGEIPIPEPDKRHTGELTPAQPPRELEVSVRRLIAHLEDRKP